MRYTVKRERRITGWGFVMVAVAAWLLVSLPEGFAQIIQGGPSLHQVPKAPVPMKSGAAKPGLVGQAKVTLPTFPKKFEIQGPERASFGFAVTQPGQIAVEVQAVGAPLVVTLQSPGGQPIIQQGPGLLRLFYNATPQDVQRSLFWQVQIRAWCEDDCLTAGKRPRAGGSVMVQHPPVDQAAVQKAMQAMAAQQKQLSLQEQQQADAQAVAQMEQAFQQRQAQFEQFQQQRRAALYAQIQPQLNQLRSRMGMGAQIRPRGLEEAGDVKAEGVSQEEQGIPEGEVGTRALPEMRRPMKQGMQAMSIEPSRPSQAPMFPQKFQVQGPESSSFAFGVTQPGPIEVQVDSQGPPVIVTLQHLASSPITQQGVGQVRLIHPVTAEEIQKSALWVVKVRLVQPGSPASGTVMVQHPPADQAIVHAQTAVIAQQEAVQQSRSEPEAEARSRAEFHEFKSRLDQQYQQRLTAERAQNQTLLNRLRAKPGNMIRSRGLNPVITSITKNEGQPKTQVIIHGTNFGPGGEVVFQLGPNITGTGIWEAWADTVIVAYVPDASGLLPYQGTVAVKVGQTLSNAVPFKFIPVEEPREIRSAQGQDVSLADPSILTGSKIEHPNQSFGGLGGSQGNDIFFPSRQLSNGWVVQDIKLEVDPCSYPDCRGAYVADSRIRTPWPFFNVRWGHGPFVGARYWFTLWIVGPRGVPDGISVTGPLMPVVPPGTPPPATTASNTPEGRTPPEQPPYNPPASSQPIEMTVVPINPALIPGYQVGPGAGTGTTPSQPPAGQSGTKMAVDPKNTRNPTLYQAPPDASSSMPPQGGSSTGTGSTPQQPPVSTTPVITSLSVSQGQPEDPVIIYGSNFGSGTGEIHFVIAPGKDVMVPAGAIWSDGEIATSVPIETGLLAFNGQLYIKRASDGKMSNLVPFSFVPRQKLRTIYTIPGDRRHSQSFLTYPNPRNTQMDHARIYGIPFGEFAGEKGNDEFFLLAQLKNGWTVSAVRFFPPREFYPSTMAGALQLNALADGLGGAYVEQQGSGARPYLNIRWWINPFVPSMMYRYQIDIVGPEGVPDGIVVP